MTRSKRLAQLAKRVTEVEKNITEGMTDYEAALLMFNDKLFNAKGLYKTVKPQEDGSIILYFHDETELENSHVIQMFSAAGFAWTTDGWNNGELIVSSVVSAIYLFAFFSLCLFLPLCFFFN